MQTHTVKRNTKRAKHVQLGRGGRHGKTSGRGGKGQTARAGNKRRPALRDAIKKIPKLRGYRFQSIEIPATPVNLGEIEAVFAVSDRVTPETLLEKGLIRSKNGKVAPVKILGRGALSKKLVFSGCRISDTAKAAIEKVGGSVEVSK